MNLEKDFSVVSKEEFDSFKGDYTTSKGFRKILSALSHYEEFMGLRGLAEEKLTEEYDVYLKTFSWKKLWITKELYDFSQDKMPRVFHCRWLDDYIEPAYESLRNTIRNGEQWIISSDSCTFINEWANKDMVKLRNTLKDFLES